jgi:hypothetical protein
VFVLNWQVSVLHDRPSLQSALVVQSMSSQLPFAGLQASPCRQTSGSLLHTLFVQVSVVHWLLSLQSPLLVQPTTQVPVAASHR